MKRRLRDALLRDFFRYFFAELSNRGVTQIDITSIDVRIRFLRVIEWLEHDAREARTALSPEELEEHRCLLRALRPDPLSGALTTFEEALLEWVTRCVTIHSGTSVYLLLPPQLSETLQEAEGWERTLVWVLAEEYLADGTSRDRA